jgi:GGDEF domain-containing protein
LVATLTPETSVPDVSTPHRIHQQYTGLFDHATSLPTWPLLIDRTRMALERAARHDLLVGVIVLDDVRRRSSASPDFTTFVTSLRAAVFADDTVARIDGCSFVIVLNDVANADAVAGTTDEIVASLDVTCHVGLTFGALPCDPEELINRARRAALPPPPPPVPTWEDRFNSTTSTPWTT